jgi:hypothetical protein
MSNPFNVAVKFAEMHVATFFLRFGDPIVSKLKEVENRRRSRK